MSALSVLSAIGLLLVLILVLIAGAAWYMTVVPGRSFDGPLPPISSEEAETARRLSAHVRAIASRPHNIRHYPALEDAAGYIARTLETMGYAPEAQRFTVEGKEVRNIEAVIKGQRAASFVIGAHYDSFGDAPGANDNGTGVASLLELARLLSDWPQVSEITIRLAFFVNEEPPYFKTADMGSFRYAKRLSERGEAVTGMISLETLGSYSDTPGSQNYPAPFGKLYPETGNFIAFVGTLGARTLLHRLIAAFRARTQFPTVGGVAPGFIPGIDWSDHWAFMQFDYPAIMITDTAPYRYAHYHQTSDTPDKVDYEKLARITHGFERMMRDIATRP